MPGEAVLSAMYGEGAAEEYDPHGGLQCGHSELTLEWLDRADVGTFVDYGCGSGELLDAVQRRGWRVAGVEWSPAIAAEVGQRTGLRVEAAASAALSAMEGTVDVLHLGDVIEHLTDVEAEFARALRLLKPGGLLLAHGPLQANTTLFNAILRLVRPALRRLRSTTVAPQHVLLATRDGQRSFFRRFGLAELEFKVWEVNWPAPEAIGAADSRRPRQVALFLLAELSRRVSLLRPGVWGNRYFFVGRRPES